MNIEQATTILRQALDKGFTAGLYSMQDAAIILQALAILFPPENTNQQ